MNIDKKIKSEESSKEDSEPKSNSIGAYLLALSFGLLIVLVVVSEMVCSKNN